jgi:hypothetical protein
MAGRLGPRCFAQHGQGRRQVAVEPGRDRPGMLPFGLHAISNDQLGVRSEYGAESQPEVHRHPDDERDVGLSQGF